MLRLSISLLGFLAAAAAMADEIRGKVVQVFDGDTLAVVDSRGHYHKVRLAAIDAPERDMPYGSVSRKSLADLALGKYAVVMRLETDSYGRTVGKVIVDGRDVGLEQIKRGLAWHYKAFAWRQSDSDRSSYSSAESSAKSYRDGLWKSPNPQPPWSWRMTNK